MGKIIVVLGSAVYFVIKKCQALFLHDIGVYSLTPIQECYCCIKQDDLADYYPLPEYALCDMPIGAGPNQQGPGNGQTMQRL